MLRKFLSIILFCGSAIAQTNVARMLSGVNYQIGTTYTFTPIDSTRVTSFNNIGAVAVTLPQGTTLGFNAGSDFVAINGGAGTVTITCTSCTINGSSTLVLATNQAAEIYSDGTNYTAALAAVGGVSGGNPGGSNTQLQVNNNGVFGAIANVAAGSELVSNGVSALPIFQTKKAIDVRDAGVDCTGVADSGAALNTLFASINSTEVDFPSRCLIKTTVKLTIQGQTAFFLRGLGSYVAPAGFVGPLIFGCNAAASGPVLYINRSGWGKIEGLSITARGASPCNTSTFTSSIQIDSTGASGVTSHEIILDNLGLTTSPQGGSITNYTGVLITDGGQQNGEMIQVRNSFINCQNSPGSIGINVNNGTSDNDLAEMNNVANCNFAIQVNGNMRIQNNLLTSSGDNSVFGAFGAVINIVSCSSGAIYIGFNEEDTGGPFIDNGHSGVGGCSPGLNIIGNHIGVADIASGEYIIDTGAGGGFFNMIGNNFLVVQNTSQYIMGSVAQAANHGPLGTLLDMNNSLRTPTQTDTLGFNNLALPYQGGENHIGAISLGANGLLGPNNAVTQFSSFGQYWFPSISTGNTFKQQSPQLGLRAYTGSTNDEWLWQTIADGTTSALTFNHNAGPASTAWFNWDGNVSGINLAQLPTPAPPTGVTPVGTPGSTTYTYAIVAFGQVGNSPGSTTLSTTTGNTTLSSTNYNLLQWVPTVTIGANKWCIWRTVGGATQGKIGCVNAVGTTTNSQNADTYYFNDTGFTGDGTTLPASNTTGQIVSTVPTGLPPFSVASTTNIPNLNASLLLGNTWASPGPIGGTTPDQVTTTQINLTGTGGFSATSAGGVLPTPGTGKGGIGIAIGGIPQFNPNNAGWFNIPNMLDCGTTTTCAKTLQTLIIVRGSVPFPTATTVTVTALPFTSSTSYSCTAGDATTAAGVVNATTYTSGSSVTFTETNGVNTDTARYTCTGF